MGSSIQELVKMQDVDSIYAVMTESDDWMLCLDAAEGLVTLGDDRGLQFLKDATESDDDDIRAVAQEILASPTARRLYDETKARERLERQSALEVGKKRLSQGKKVYRYKTIYLPASDFVLDELSEDGMEVTALNNFGLEGWDVAAFFADSGAGSSRLGMGSQWAGGYFLIKKEVEGLPELEEM